MDSVARDNDYLVSIAIAQGNVIDAATVVDDARVNVARANAVLEDAEREQRRHVRHLCHLLGRPRLDAD